MFAQRTLEGHLQALLQTIGVEEMVTGRNSRSGHATQTDRTNIVPFLQFLLGCLFKGGKRPPLQAQLFQVVAIQILEA